jgi:hypothetical protein
MRLVLRLLAGALMVNSADAPPYGIFNQAAKFIEIEDIEARVAGLELAAPQKPGRRM